MTTNILPDIIPQLKIPKSNETSEAVRKAVIAKHHNNPKAAVDELKAVAKECGFMTDAEKFLNAAVDSSMMMLKPKPKPPEIIKGVLHQGCRLMITGGAKSYKTWLLLRLAECVSEGRPWLNLETVKGKVLFINLELPDYLMDERLKLIHDEINPNQPKASELLKVINVDEVNCTSAQFVSLIPELANLIRERGYALIVIDPIYSLYDGSEDENSASHMKMMLDQLKKLGNKSGAAIVYSHHHTKGGQGRKEAIDRSSGSGVFKRHPDSIIDFTELEPENDECEDFVMSFKLRGFAPKKKAGVRIHHGYKVVMDSSLKLEKIKDPGKYRQSFSETAILKVLEIQKYKVGDLKKAVMDDSGMSSATFDRLWREVKTKDGLVEDNEHCWNYIPPMMQPIPRLTQTATSK